MPCGKRLRPRSHIMENEERLPNRRLAKRMRNSAQAPYLCLWPPGPRSLLSALHAPGSWFTCTANRAVAIQSETRSMMTILLLAGYSLRSSVGMHGRKDSQRGGTLSYPEVWGSPERSWRSRGTAILLVDPSDLQNPT